MIESDRAKLLSDLKVHLGKALEPEILRKISQREIHITRSEFLDIMHCVAHFAESQRFHAVADLAKGLMRDTLKRSKAEETPFDAEHEFAEDLKKI